MLQENNKPVSWFATLLNISYYYYFILQPANLEPDNTAATAHQNGKIPSEKANGKTVNGTKNNVEDVIPIPEEVPVKPLKRADSRKDRQKRISFRGE